MKLICSIFGHRLPRLPGLTSEVRYEGTQHSFRTDIYWMYQPCTRCGKHFMVGRFTLYDGKVRM